MTDGIEQVGAERLRRAIDRIAAATPGWTDHDLERAWPSPPQPGERWYGYGDTVREVFFQVYQELRELTVDVLVARPPLTRAQLALAQHHRAFRDLTGALATVSDAEVDLVPAPGEWPLRTVVYHMYVAERGFYVQVSWALERFHAEMPAAPTPDGEAERRAGDITDAGTLAELLARFAALHERVLSECAALTDAELAVPSLWWEQHELPILFRLHRFDAHLREHTIQVDKTLAGIGRPPTEADRLVRLLHRALGECEAAWLGAPDTKPERIAQVATHLSAIASALEALA